jgi:hypothetical protein
MRHQAEIRRADDHGNASGTRTVTDREIALPFDG